MARTLDRVLVTLLSGSQACSYGYSTGLEIPPNNKKKFMKIPINQEIFELPVMLSKTLPEIPDENITSLIITLQDQQHQGRYVTLERNMREILLSDFKDEGLYKTDVKQGNETITYYVGRGAVFDKDFHPLMMLSWELETTQGTETPYKLRRVLMRVSPDCYLNKTDPMRRLITNKIVNLLLGFTDVQWTLITVPKWIAPTEFYRPTVEISEFPFQITSPTMPNPTTTSKELISLAKDYIKEITQ